MVTMLKALPSNASLSSQLGKRGLPPFRFGFEQDQRGQAHLF